MADDDKIVQEIELKGEQEVVDGFERIGTAGEKAMEKISESAGSVAAPLGSVSAAADKAGAGMATAGVKAERAGTSILFGARSADAMRAALNQSTAATAAAAAANAELDTSQKKVNISARDVARTLSLFGRLTHTREITQFGRAISVLSRGLQGLAVPVAAVILERIANSAAKANEEVDKLAIESKLTTEAFTEIASAGIAVGVSNDDFAKGLQGIGKLLQEGADNERKFADETRAFGDKMEQASQKGAHLSQQLVDIGVHGSRAIRDLTNEQRKFAEGQVDASTDFEKSLRKLEEQRKDIFSGGPNPFVARQRALRDNEEAEDALLRKRSQAIRQAAEEQVKLFEKASDEAKKNREEVARNIDAQVALEKSVRDARREFQLAGADFEKNKTAIQKLGIANLDAAGKIKQTPDALHEIADALSKLPDGMDKIKIKSDLVAAGLDQKLLPALEKGSAEFKRLSEEGQSIRPLPVGQTAQNLRDFAIASDQAGSALAGLKDAFGAALAPAFTGFLIQLKDIFVSLQPGVKELGTTLANILGPALTTIGNVIQNIVVPAFKGIFAVIGEVATAINNLVGTNLTAWDLIAVAIVGFIAVLAPVPAIIAALTVAVGLLLNAISENKGAVIAFGIAVVALIAFFFPWTTAIVGIIAVLAVLVNKWPEIKAAAIAALGAVAGGFESLRQRANDAINAVIGFFQPMIDKIKEAIDWIKQLFGAKEKVAAQDAGGGGEKGFARGGSVRGRGTGVSDSIWARLSNGEFVIKAAAVRKYGLSVMHTINQMRAPISGFAQGGLVSLMSPMMGPIPSFAGGGSVAGRSMERPIQLNIGGEEFHLFAREKDTANNLTRFAASRRIKSSGRKASYIGSGR